MPERRSSNSTVPEHAQTLELKKLSGILILLYWELILLERTIDLGRVIRRMIKKAWLIAVVTVVVAVIGCIYTMRPSPDVYGSRVSLYSVAYGSYRASIEGFNAMKDYAEIVGSKKVAERVIGLLPQYALDAGTIQSMVRTSYTEESAIFYITAYSTVPELAVSVANAVAEAFVLEVRNVTGEDSVKILDKAETVILSFNAKSEQTRTRLTFAAGGFIAICAVLAVTELFGTKVKEVDDATLNGDIKLLGVIPDHSI